MHASETTDRARKRISKVPSKQVVKQYYGPHPVTHSEVKGSATEHFKNAEIQVMEIVYGTQHFLLPQCVSGDFEGL